MRWIVVITAVFALTSLPGCGIRRITWGGNDPDEVKIEWLEDREKDDTVDDEDSPEKLDTTNDRRLAASLKRMMREWSKAKKARFATALGACIAEAGTRQEKTDSAMLRSLEGMTAGAIFAKAKAFRQEKVSEALSFQHDGAATSAATRLSEPSN
jgi:hypothetical protein